MLKIKDLGGIYEMLLLIAVLFCMFTYKFFTKWVWIILPFALVIDGLIWIRAHQLLFWVILSAALITYDLIYRHQHNGKDPFYDNLKDKIQPAHTATTKTNSDRPVTTVSDRTSRPTIESVDGHSKTPDKPSRDEITSSIATPKPAKELFHFKVAGTTHYDMKRFVDYARKNDLFEKYDGMTAKEIKEDSPYDEVYETDLLDVDYTIALQPDPNNEYDSDAIKVNAIIDGQEFQLGFVPKEHTSNIKKILQDGNFKIEGSLTGGKYKIAEDDDDDFSDNPKLKIKTGINNYGFNIVIYNK
ncbi:HIRAN domain-containing protein [Lactiplantibacillus plantarum]